MFHQYPTPQIRLNSETQKHSSARKLTYDVGPGMDMLGRGGGIQMTAIEPIVHARSHIFTILRFTIFNRIGVAA